MSSELTSSTNITVALQRLTKHLRALLRSMSGEDSDSDDPDQDDRCETGSAAAVVAGLTTLIDALDEEEIPGYPDTDGRADWALERECEITRLERENEDLRKMLAIDSASIAETGVTVDEVRVESGRHAAFLSAAARRRSSSGSGFGMGGESWGMRPPQSTAFMIDPPGGSLYSNGSQPQQQGGPLQQQHNVELQGQGVRFQGRRPAMFGVSHRGNLGLGRSGGQNVAPSSMWSHQALSPASPTPERPWQSQTGSNLDLSR